MNDEFNLEISIPADDDGYVLLQCEHCGTYFKISADDDENDEILHVFCPSCGLISDSYVTEDVLELAEKMVHNVAMDMIYDAFKNLERNNNRFIKFKAGSKPNHEPESPIHSGIEALEIAEFSCCRRNAKIKPLLKITGCYCPFCGVKNYEVE